MFPTVVQEIESVLEKIELPHEDKEELKFLLAQSKKNVQAWKAHLLRSVNQDDARLDILDGLDDESVLVVLDWAMKLIPQKYRESQADWFGKRGISWHISVAMRKHQQTSLTMLTLVHIFKKSNQDSLNVLAVIDDVIHQLKCVVPNLKRVNFRQDNAGCYHSAATILGIKELAQKHDVKIRLDYSDPQGGKGPCDRKAANIKTHIRAYLNSGHDIETAEDMKMAIASNGGVRGVSTVLCGPLHLTDTDPFPKWEGVSLINDVEFQECEMKVWRAYEVGKGKLVPYSKFISEKHSKALPTLEKIKDADPKPVFCDLTTRKTTSKKTNSDTRHNEPDSGTEDDTLFACTQEGCVRSYQTHSSLQKHLDFGKHKYALERETLLDKAMLKYAENLEAGQANVKDKDMSEETPSPLATEIPNSQMGWALKNSTTQRRRLTENQKKYLTDLFILGEQTGRKSDPNEVATSMRKARNKDGAFLFQSDSYLTSKQIAGFFSRLSSKKTLPSRTPVSETDDDDETDDFLSLTQEQALDNIRQEVINELGIKHPIVYDAYNICEMANTSKLNKFSISMLQDICNHYELDISTVKQHRKKPYIDMLTDLVKSCTCQC